MMASVEWKWLEIAGNGWNRMQETMVSAVSALVFKLYKRTAKWSNGKYSNIGERIVIS